jgi:hypothetical protein
MARGKQVNFEIDVNAAKAEQGLRQFSRGVRRAMRETEEALDDTSTAGQKVAKVLSQMAQDMDAELRDAASAAEVLKTALGETGDRMDVDQVVIDLNKMGLSFDEIRADADTLATSLKQIDDIRLGQVGAGLDDMRTRLDGVRTGTDNTGSVFANFAGSAAQELPGIAGAFGPLNMAISQFTEYASEGNIAIGEFAKAGLAIGLITAAFQSVNSLFSEWNNAQKLADTQMQNLVDHFEGLKFSAEEYQAAIEGSDESLSFIEDESRNIRNLWTEIVETIKPGDQDIHSIRDALAEAGVTMGIFAEAVTGSVDDLAAMDAILLKAVEDGRITAEQYRQIVAVTDREVRRVAEIQNNARLAAEVTSDSIDDINAGMAEQRRELSSVELLWSQLIADIKDGKIDTDAAAASWNTLRDTLGLSEEAMRELTQTKLAEQMEADAQAAEEFADAVSDAGEALEGITDIDLRATGWEAATDQIARFSQMTRSLRLGDIASGIEGMAHAMGEAVAAGVDLNQVDFTPETLTEIASLGGEVIGVTEAIAGLADTVNTELADAFTTGGAEAARGAASRLREEITAMLAGGGLEAGKIQEILTELGLIDIEPTIRLAGAEAARAALEGISSTIDTLVEQGVIAPEIALQIALAEDPVAALQTAIDAVGGVGVPITAETEAFLESLGVIVDDDYVATVSVDDDGAIATMGDDIDAATEDRTTQVIVPKSPTLGQMQDLIDHVARERTVQFVAKSDNAGTVDAILDEVANPGGLWREADIIATVDARNAARTLDILDEPRTVHLHVVTHQHGGGGGGAVVEQSAQPALLSATAATSPTTPAATPMHVIVDNPTPAATPAVVHINSPMIGNRFELDRIVTRALRRSQRINGRRRV